MSSKIDFYYRKLVLTQFFTRGWGDPASLNKIIDYRRNFIGSRESCIKLLSDSKGVDIKIDKESDENTHTTYDCQFESPLVRHMPELMPNEIHTARFQLLIPKSWTKLVSFKKNLKPICIHLAGTGDHYFWRRRMLLAKPLVDEYSIGSIILENPFYGVRKPKDQTRSSLHYVRDLFVMGANLVTECYVLMRWLETLGYGPFILSGLSMGGHMASLAGTVWPKPVAIVPCLSWTTASTVFTRGVMSQAIPWPLLQTQFYGDSSYRDILARLKQNEPTNNVNYSHLSNVMFNFNEIKQVDRVIVDFMRLLMDECTHMNNYDRPVDTQLVRVLSAKNDAYVLRDGVECFTSVWPGCQVDYVDQGHVSTFLFGQNRYRQTIKQTIDLLINKHFIDTR